LFQLTLTFNFGDFFYD